MVIISIRFISKSSLMIVNRDICKLFIEMVRFFMVISMWGSKFIRCRFIIS